MVPSYKLCVIGPFLSQAVVVSTECILPGYQIHVLKSKHQKTCLVGPAFLTTCVPNYQAQQIFLLILIRTWQVDFGNHLSSTLSPELGHVAGLAHQM